MEDDDNNDEHEGDGKCFSVRKRRRNEGLVYGNFCDRFISDWVIKDGLLIIFRHLSLFLHSSVHVSFNPTSFKSL